MKSGPVVLDFSGAETVREIHERLKEAFGFPEYYGNNWDALHDCLTDFAAACGGCSVEIKGFFEMEDRLRNQCAPMLSVFSDVCGEYPELTVKTLS